MLNSRWKQAGWAALVVAVLSVVGRAQCPNDNPVRWEAWVDPVLGDNSLATVDQVGVPGTARDLRFKTIQTAIDAVNAQLLQNEEGIVHLMPGLYSSNLGEAFPIHMRPKVHVQGAGAKECVLRARSGGGMMLHYPLNGTTNEPARRMPGTLVAVDFSTAAWGGTELDDSVSGPMLDGVTIQGADVQVSMEDEHTIIRGRVSNCVFDMRDVRDSDSENISGPDFGVLVCAKYWSGGTYRDAGVATHYPPHHIQLFNNTFVQGALRSRDAAMVDLSLPDSVAVCDFAEPMTPSSGPNPEDPDIRVRGINRHNIQNNLFRCLDTRPRARTAMLGVDLGDAHCALARGLSTPRPTNAFNRGTATTKSVQTGLYSVLVLAPNVLPSPRVDLGPTDPGFVGEYLTQNRGAYIRDFRLLPDSVLVDQGASPLYTTGCGRIGAVNGLIHQESLGSLEQSFDFDGEVHGNPRIAGNEVDIGFDETDALLLAGSYGNDTKSHFNPWNPNLGVEPGAGTPVVPQGLADRSYITRVPMPMIHTITTDTALANVVTLAPPVPSAWDHMLGTFAVLTLLPLPSPLPPLPMWVDFTHPSFNSSVTSNSLPASWTNWQSAQVHSFGEFIWVNADDVVLPAPFPPVFTSYFNSQIVFIDAQGNLVSSNLQSEYF